MEDDHDGQQLQKLALIKTLLIDYCDLNTICLNDPISQILTKDVMKSLVKDGVLLRKNKHTYAIQKNDKEKEYVSHKVLDRGLMGEDVNYIKALYVTVTMKHVTAEKLRTALKETIGRTTANAFILKMIDDNIVEPRVCKGYGNVVIRNSFSLKIFKEATAALNAMNEEKPIFMSRKDGCEVDHKRGPDSIASDVSDTSKNDSRKRAMHEKQDKLPAKKVCRKKKHLRKLIPKTGRWYIKHLVMHT